MSLSVIVFGCPSATEKEAPEPPETQTPTSGAGKPDSGQSLPPRPFDAGPTSHGALSDAGLPGEFEPVPANDGGESASNASDAGTQLADSGVAVPHVSNDSGLGAVRADAGVAIGQVDGGLHTSVSTGSAGAHRLQHTGS